MPAMDPADKAIAELRAAARLEANLRGARESFSSFVETCVTDPSGKPFVLEPLHRYWHSHVGWCWANSLHAGIMSHWESGKSAGLVVPLPAWLIGKNPNLRIKTVCSSTELARERVEAVKSLITSTMYQLVFPHIRPGVSWKANEFTVERKAVMADPSLQAKSVFGKGVGKRADVIIFDDVVDQLNAAEPAQRKKVREFVSSTWMSRLSPGGKVLWVATPWNTDDATAHLMRRPNWCFLLQRVLDMPDEFVVTQEVHGIPQGLQYPLMPLAR